MGGYEDLVEQTVEAVLAPGRPLPTAEIEALIRRALGPGRLLSVRVLAVLRARSQRFVEVAPGVWARRSDGTARRIFDELKKRKILIRYMAYEGYGDGLRISIGSDADIDRLVGELKKMV